MQPAPFSGHIRIGVSHITVLKIWGAVAPFDIYSTDQKTELVCRVVKNLDQCLRLVYIDIVSFYGFAGGAVE
jgi:hypothetical protein